jgi:hypothetical protein
VDVAAGQAPVVLELAQASYQQGAAVSWQVGHSTSLS